MAKKLLTSGGHYENNKACIVERGTISVCNKKPLGSNEIAMGYNVHKTIVCR